MVLKNRGKYLAGKSLEWSKERTSRKSKLQEGKEEVSDGTSQLERRGGGTDLEVLSSLDPGVARDRKNIGVDTEELLDDGRR